MRGYAHSFRAKKGKKRGMHGKKREPLFRTGTNRDREAANVIISKVKNMNHQGLMKLIQDGQDKGVVSIFSCCRGLNLDNEGLVIVSRLRQKIGGREEELLPVVRVVDQQQARKAYSDYLSEQVTKRLRISNPGIIKRQERGKINNDDNGIAGEAGDYKIVRVSWQITSNDLHGQKKHEIESPMKKGEAVRIVFDDKRNFARSRARKSQNPDDMDEVETTRREKVVNFVSQLIESMGTTLEREGTIGDKLMFKVKPLELDNNDKEEKKRQKNLKKKERQEKIRLRTERKRAKEMEEMKVMNVD